MFLPALPQLRQPGDAADEGCAPGDVIDKERTGGSAEVGLGDCPEGFLPGGVPDLELDASGRVGGDEDGPGTEFDADGDVVVGLEAAFAEADGQGGFAGGGVAYGDDFLGGVRM